MIALCIIMWGTFVMLSTYLGCRRLTSSFLSFVVSWTRPIRTKLFIRNRMISYPSWLSMSLLFLTGRHLHETEKTPVNIIHYEVSHFECMPNLYCLVNRGNIYLERCSSYSFSTNEPRLPRSSFLSVGADTLKGELQRWCIRKFFHAEMKKSSQRSLEM